MHIINAMFGRGLGGIEQSFVDYAQALTHSGHTVTALVHPQAKIIPVLRDTCPNIEIITIVNHGQWDPTATLRLRRVLKQKQADAIIAHGNRAIHLLSKANQRHIPLIGVAHNYSIKRMAETSFTFTITNDLKKKVIALGKSPENVFVIPNMISVPDSPPHSTHTSPVIGTMGRFVCKKGFNIFIESLAQLKKEGLEFSAIIGGSGAEKSELEQLAKDLDLTDTISFTGWVENKDDFFSKIDIFCLPSLHEPFGIVILEAWAHKIPVISTDTEGPTEIIHDGFNGLLTPKDDPLSLSRHIAELLHCPKLTQEIATAGYNAAQESYSIPVVAKKIDNALKEIITSHEK